jgi:hypothetical protein
MRTVLIKITKDTKLSNIYGEYFTTLEEGTELEMGIIDLSDHEYRVVYFNAFGEEESIGYDYSYDKNSSLNDNDDFYKIIKEL